MLNIPLLVLRCMVMAALAFGAGMPASAASRTTYALAVIPSAPPVPTHTAWMPFVERLSSSTGLGFRLKLYENMADFEQDIWSGRPDFIFSSPIQLMVAHGANGYIPLVRGEVKVSVGLFVRNDSAIRSIEDLAGKKIAFVGSKNLCSVTMRHLLGNHKENLFFSTEYTGSTRNVIINVLLGNSDAGAVYLPEMPRQPEESRNQLRQVLATPEMAPHPLSAHPRVPRKDQEAVKKAILAIAATRDGAEQLQILRLPAPIAADYDRDFRALEDIDVKGLTNWGK